MVAEIVTHPLRVMELLFEFRPDLILMDINMPDCNGIELAGVIRQKDVFFRIPIIFLTSQSTYDRRLLALQGGGDDFLAKPVRADLLVSSLKSRAERARQFDLLISRDGMTGIVNHSKIKEFLETEVLRGQRENRPLAFAMLDIDHFKSVNDSHGHWTGDTVIKALARVLSQRLRKTDFIGRYGGEEFAVILPNTEGADAARR
jgi:PleD family two-component response regulator